MISRRGVLAFLTGAVAAPLVVKADSLMKLRGVIMPQTFIDVPSWCPAGWIPADGRTISRFQFPELYEVFKHQRMYGAEAGDNFRLPSTFPMIEYNAYEVLNPTKDKIVSLINVKLVYRANGTQCIPGMMVHYQKPNVA